MANIICKITPIGDKNGKNGKSDEAVSALLGISRLNDRSQGNFKINFCWKNWGEGKNINDAWEEKAGTLDVGNNEPRAVEVQVVAADSEFMQNKTHEEFKQIFGEIIKILTNKFGKENILQVDVHYDIEAPELCAILIPIIQVDGKKEYSIREFLGGREGIAQLKAELDEYVGKRWGVKAEKQTEADEIKIDKTENINKEYLLERIEFLNEREKELRIREEDLQKKDNELKELEKILKIAEEKVNIQNEQLKTLEEALSVKENAVCEKDNELNCQSDRLDKREYELKQTKLLLDVKKNEIDAKENILNEREGELDTKEQRLKEFENELVLEKEKISNKTRELTDMEQTLEYKIKEIENNKEEKERRDFDFKLKDAELKLKEEALNLDLIKLEAKKYAGKENSNTENMDN